MAYHAMVTFNNSCSMIVGGFTDYDVISRSTLFYNHIKKTWSDGPMLRQGRWRHAAGVVTDEFTNEKLIVATGGVYVVASNVDYLDSIEVLFENQWHIGKELAEMLILYMIINDYINDMTLLKVR